MQLNNFQIIFNKSTVKLIVHVLSVSLSSDSKFGKVVSWTFPKSKAESFHEGKSIKCILRRKIGSFLSADSGFKIRFRTRFKTGFEAGSEAEFGTEFSSRWEERFGSRVQKSWHKIWCIFVRVWIPGISKLVQIVGVYAILVYSKGKNWAARLAVSFAPDSL